MAERNHRSYRDPTAAQGASTTSRDQPDDPLAELARLLGQTLPMNGWSRDARRSTPAGSRSAHELNPPAPHSYAASDVVQETSEEQYSIPEQGSYDFDLPNVTYDDGRYEASRRADASHKSRSAWYKYEPQSHSHPADLHVKSLGARYEEYEDQSHDQPDDYAYGEDYEEDPNPRRRDKFIFVAAVFGLALLGTGGTFAYRALLADSIVPPLLSIGKAESGPNKITTTSTASQGTVLPRSDADKAGSSGEERAVDVPPPVSSAPPPVFTAPIFPEPAPAPGPGAASVFPLTPLAQPEPVAGVDSLNSSPAAPAPPIPSANQVAAPDALTPTPASPTTPGPKKIRTVSIRMHQPNAADSAASQPQSAPVRPAQQQVTKPSDANARLSIVPSSNDAATAEAGSARTAPPAHPAVGKPAATKIASTSPAAPGGGYAVQVLSQRNEKEVQSSFRALQAKYPELLGGHKPMVRRADLGAKGVYYRAMVGPFVSAEQANELCANLKAAGASCIVQKN
jgi:hypothetical protein